MKRMIWGLLVAAGLIIPVWVVATSSPVPNVSNAETSAIPTLDAVPVSSMSVAATPVTEVSSGEQPIGEIFGVPVRRANYEFAKRVASMFPQPWGGADLPAEAREAFIWEQLILHYESFRRNVQPTQEHVDALINELLKNSKQPFTRRADPDAYKRWVVETLYEDVPFFETQMLYLLQIQQLKDQVYQSIEPAVTEEEMQQEFLNEAHHVGGDMVVFDQHKNAEAFYQRVRTPKAWEKMTREGTAKVQSVSMMTLEAYMDLWQIPKDQIYAFHNLEIGQVGPPMPFGGQWCVYRLLEKRTGDVKDFPAKRESYYKQLAGRKKYHALHQWIEEFIKQANRTPSVSAPAASGS